MNGFENYETWAASLWIDTDEGTQAYWNDMARGLLRASDEDEDALEIAKDRAIDALAESLKEEIRDNAPELKGLYADLLNAALSEINWREIAEHLVEGVDE